MIFKFPAAGIQLMRVAFITVCYLAALFVAYERDPKDVRNVIIALLIVAPFDLAPESRTLA